MPTTAGTPADVITAFAAAIQHGHVEDALSLYEQDAVFIPQPGADPISGHETCVLR